MSETPWILATQQPMGFWCRRCDGRLTVGFPVSTTDYTATGKVFVETHQTCVVPAEGGEE